MTYSHYHPLTVHFPIALLIAGFVYDAITLFFCKDHKLSKAGLYLMVLGTLGAFAAYLTGEYFTFEMDGPAGEKKEEHELYAKITMWFMLAVSVLRVYVTWKKKEQSGLKWLIFVLFACGAGLVGFTGYLGGSLVYDVLLP